MSDWLPWVVFGLYVLWTEYRLHRQRVTIAELRRRLPAAAVLLLLTGRAEGGPPLDDVKPRAVHAYAKDPRHPDNAIVDALVWLDQKVPPEDWTYYRFFHFLSTADEDLPDEVGNWKAYLQMLNGTAPGPVRPIPVDRAGRVWAVDRREAGWSAAAFHAVAVLDQTCTEPNLNHQLAEELRRAIGVGNDPGNFHCEGLVPAPWFVREAQTTDRHRKDPENAAYYNLLYSRERFGDDFPPVGFVAPGTRAARERRPVREGTGTPAAPPVPADPGPEPPRARSRPWEGDRPWSDGRWYPAGSFTYIPYAEQEAADKAREAWRNAKAAYRDYQERLKTTAGSVTARTTLPPAPPIDPKHHGDGFIDRDFPKDAAQFQERWGVKAVQDFLTKQRIFKTSGTIIAGYFNDPKAGSLVSDNDRVNLFANGPLGVAMETRDFEITAGKRNLVNNPLGVALDEIPEDASEKIYQKQDDWPVFWLNGPRGEGAKRVESGDPHIVHDRVNGGTVIVQTVDKCVGCHYPSDVVLAPSNEKLHARLRRGQELLAYTKAEQLVIDRFFFDGDAAGPGWQRNLKKWREPFSTSLTYATRTNADPRGWDGAKFASVSNSRRDWYDAPVRLGQAAAELGYPRLAVVTACLILGDSDAAELALDAEPGVPRAAWDADLFPRLSNALAYARDAEVGDPIFRAFFPDLVRDAREKVYELKNPKGGK